MNWLKSATTTCREMLTILVATKPDVENEPDEAMKHATEFMTSFTPKDGVDYSLVMKHAQDLYRENREATASLDKKVDWFFGIAAGAIAGVLGGKSSLGLTVVQSGCIAIPFLVAMGLAIRAKAPLARFQPIIIPFAIPIAEQVKDLSSQSGCFAVGLHHGMTVIQTNNEWKGRLIAGATRYVYLGAVILVIGVIWANSSKPTSSDSVLRPRIQVSF